VSGCFVSDIHSSVINNQQLSTEDSLAVSLLLNLEAAQQGRSMLFSDEQRLLFKGRKKGFA
jgi:hypothetical protein